MNSQDMALTRKLIDKYGGGTVSDDQLNSAIDKKIADGTIASGEQLETIEQQKTDKSTTTNIQTQVNNLVLGAVGNGNNAEVIQARGKYTVLNERISFFENEIDKLYSTTNPIDLQIGLIDTNGNLNSSFTNRCFTNHIKNIFDYIEMPIDYSYKIMYYTEAFQGVFIEGTPWLKGRTVSIATHNYFRLTIKKDDESVLIDLENIRNSIRIGYKNKNIEAKYVGLLQPITRSSANNIVEITRVVSKNIKNIEMPSGYLYSCTGHSITSNFGNIKYEYAQSHNLFNHDFIIYNIKIKKIDGTTITEDDLKFLKTQIKVYSQKPVVVHGGIPSSTGENDFQGNSKSTNYFYASDNNKISSSHQFGIRYYDENLNYIWGSKIWENEHIIQDYRCKWYSLNLQPTNASNTELNILADKIKIERYQIKDKEYSLTYATTINPNNSIVDKKNSLMLISCKMNKTPNSVPYTEGYLYLDVFNNFKFYYSAGVPDVPKYLFTWDSSISDLPPTEYNCYIAQNGDLIFVYKSELLRPDVVRKPAIVCSYPNYNATVINLTDKNNPIGWLQNCGIDYLYNDNDSIIFGEYTRATSDKMRVWKITKPYNNPLNWNVKIELTRSDIGLEVGLKHFHTLEVDTFTNIIYGFTGDDDDYSRVYVSKDNGNSFTLLQSGPEKHLRTLNLLFLKDGVYWGTDGGKEGRHIFCKALRKSDGVVDFLNTQEVYVFKDKNVRFSTYATCLIKEPYGILFLDRFDGNTTEYLEIRFYDLSNNKMYLADVIKPLNTVPKMYGFRNETVNFYPSYADNRVCCGFVNYPNNMDLLNNSYSKVEDVIGKSSDYLTNNNKINNLLINVIRC